MLTTTNNPQHNRETSKALQNRAAQPFKSFNSENNDTLRRSHTSPHKKSWRKSNPRSTSALAPSRSSPPRPSSLHTHKCHIQQRKSRRMPLNIHKTNIYLKDTPLLLYHHQPARHPHRPLRRRCRRLRLLPRGRRAHAPLLSGDDIQIPIYGAQHPTTCAGP